MAPSPLNLFLRKLAERIAPHAAVRNLVIPQMRSPEVYDSFEPLFRKDLSEFFDARALDMMDYLSVNEYWFIMMAAAALVRCRSLPARSLDVQEGIFLLRNRLRRGPLGSKVFAKLQQGQADKLNSAEADYARREGLLVWGESYGATVIVKVNPVFFQNTGAW